LTSDGFVWIDPPDKVFPAGMDAYLRDIRAGIMMLAQRRAPEIETWLKQNAPWEDRTGNARQTLHTEVQIFAEQVVIELAHGVSYGIFLETMQGGTFSVLGPALDHWASIIWDDVNQLLRG
jgi:hypothetical protein